MLFWVLIIAVSVLAVGYILSSFTGVRNQRDQKRSASEIAFVSLVGASPLIAAFIYVQVGQPEALSPEFAEQSNDEITASTPEDDPAAQQQEMIEGMVAGLAERLAQDPDDVEGWRMLGRSYSALGRTVDAAAAYAEALQRAEEPALDDLRNYAGALVAISVQTGRALDVQTVSVLETLLSQSPDDPMALFYLGLAAREARENEKALDYWTRLKAVIPENAPIMNELDAMIAGVSNRSQ